MVKTRWADLQHGRKDPNVRGFKIGGQRIAVCQTSLGYFAMLDSCPHDSVRLTKYGYLREPAEIFCSMHACQFDLTTGKRSDASQDATCPRNVSDLALIKVTQDGEELVFEV